MREPNPKLVEYLSSQEVFCPVCGSKIVHIAEARCLLCNTLFGESSVEQFKIYQRTRAGEQRFTLMMIWILGAWMVSIVMFVKSEIEGPVIRRELYNHVDFRVFLSLREKLHESFIALVVGGLPVVLLLLFNFRFFQTSSSTLEDHFTWRRTVRVVLQRGVVFLLWILTARYAVLFALWRFADAAQALS